MSAASAPIFVYPADYFHPQRPDSLFQAEAAALTEQGLGVYAWNGGRFTPTVPVGLRPLYRGWMLSLAEYQALYANWAQQGVLPLTSPEHYALTHYLPNWYSLLKDWTPETVRVKFPEELTDTLSSLEWPAYFLKDDVKSLKAGGGSLLHSAADGERWLREMKHFRGQIEGGICIRRVEAWLPETEQRWFVWQGQAFGPDASAIVPEPVQVATELIDSPFFSVDIVKTQAGQWRIVELGDGQVSDLVGWEPSLFAAVFSSANLFS
jgi:hypothetical protein